MQTRENKARRWCITQPKERINVRWARNSACARTKRHTVFRAGFTGGNCESIKKIRLHNSSRFKARIRDRCAAPVKSGRRKIQKCVSRPPKRRAWRATINSQNFITGPLLEFYDFEPGDRPIFPSLFCSGTALAASLPEPVRKMQSVVARGTERGRGFLSLSREGTKITIRSPEMHRRNMIEVNRDAR